MNDHKATLLEANDYIISGDNEMFLSLCTEDVVWEFVGEQVLRGKQAVRDYIATAYATPPEFFVDDLISESNHVVAIGRITLKNGDGNKIHAEYCDVWKFRENKMAALKAFVSEIKPQ